MASSLYVTNQLKIGREAKGWSQEDLAAMFSLETGIPATRSLIQKWELGERTIAANTALEMARFMRIDIRELVKRKEK